MYSIGSIAYRAHPLSLASLQFDVICCTFIYGCERRNLCAKQSDKLGFRVRGRGSIRVSKVRVRVRVRVRCKLPFFSMLATRFSFDCVVI